MIIPKNISIFAVIVVKRDQLFFKKQEAFCYHFILGNVGNFQGN